MTRLDDPQDAEVAKQYKLDIELFNQTAKYWTSNFATEGKEPEDVKSLTTDDKLSQLWDMGFDEDMAREALERYDDNVELASNYLLGG